MYVTTEPKLIFFYFLASPAKRYKQDCTKVRRDFAVRQWLSKHNGRMRNTIINKIFI